MKKVNAIVILLLIFSLLGLMFYLFKSQNEYENLNKEFTTLYEEHMELEEKQITMDMMVSDLKTLIASKEELLQKLYSEKYALNEQLLERDKAIEEFEEIQKEQNRKVEYLQFELSNQLIYDNTLMDLNLTESEAIGRFGKPVSETIDVIGSDNVWYLEGKYRKESIHRGFNLLYYGDDNGENYKLVEISTESDDLYMINGLRVGDTIDALFNSYSRLQKDTWSNNGERYLYAYDMVGIFFNIEENRISKISIRKLFD